MEKPTLIDVVLVAIYFAVTLIALRLIGFGWWWTIPLALVIAAAAWAVGHAVS